MTRPESFTKVQSWLSEIETYCANGGRDVVMVLVGNKIDKVHERAISTAAGEAFARSKGMLFLESSALNGENVIESFEEVVRKILESPTLLAGTTPMAPRKAADKPVVLLKPPVAAAGAGGGCC